MKPRWYLYEKYHWESLNTGNMLSFRGGSADKGESCTLAHGRSMKHVKFGTLECDALLRSRKVKMASVPTGSPNTLSPVATP